MITLLDFNFSFGEHFYNGEPSSMFNGFFYTLLGIIITFCFTLIRDWSLKQGKIKSDKRYFTKTLKLATSNVEQAIIVYVISLIIQCYDLYTYNHIKTLNFKQLNYLSNLNNSELREIFRNNKNVDRYDFDDIFMNIEDCINIIRCVDVSILDNQRQYFGFVSNIEQNYYEIIYTLMARKSYFTNIDDTSNSENIYTNILLDNFKPENIHNFKRIREECIPQFLNDDLFKYFDYDISIKLMTNARHIIYNIDKITAINKAIVKSLKMNTISRLGENLTSFKKLLKKLDDSQ